MVKKKPSKSEKKQKKQKEGIISPVNSINGGDKDESKKNQVKNNKDSNNLNLDNETTALSDIKISKTKKLDAEDYERELSKLQVELVKLQEWIKHVGMKVVVIFEGRDAAGKGGVIKRITQRLNPRVCRIVALGTPTDREKTQWYFQRYVSQLPAAGEMVLFDRSWYNRAEVERVMGFCSELEYQEFLRSCPEFERMLVRSGIKLLKYWFSVSNDEQERRFQSRNTIQQNAGS